MNGEQPDDVEAEIQAALQALWADATAVQWNRTEWTRRVKEAVGQVVNAHGYRWHSSDNGGEWLWDGAALERDEDGNLIDLQLALESELHGWAEIKVDFEKLMTSRAPHRVFVCTATSRDGVKEHLNRLEEMIRKFRRSGDRYLLAGLFWPERGVGDFIFRSHVVG